MPFSKDHADIAVKFFEVALTHTKGKYAKKAFKLASWQKPIIRDLFGTLKKDGNRQYSTAYVEIPKKNGKSELAAGIALYGLFMDEEPGAEIYSAAATREQASIVFKIAAQMVRNNPTLLRLCRIVDSTKTIYLKDDPTCFYKAISADAGKQDGINPHFVIFDELHRQKHRDLWDVLTMGSDTRVRPLFFAITTAGIKSESPLCWDQHEYARQILSGVFKDSTFYPVIYSLPEDEDWSEEGKPGKGSKKPTGWYGANPALGDFLRVDKVQEQAKKAKRIPSEQNSFRRLRLNQWVSQETRWIDLREWNACDKAFNPTDLLGKGCYAGLDLSGTRDITALVLAFPIEDEMFLLSQFWLPEHELIERSKRDKVPYDLWAKQGLLNLTPGNVVDYDFVRESVKSSAELYEIKEIAYDPYNALQLSTQLGSDGFEMVPFRQGFLSMSPASKEFERLILKRSIRHGGNPILKWMMDCLAIAHDPAGNIKPVKPKRDKSSKRIDGIVASIMGVARAIGTMTQPSVYEERGILTV